MTDAHPLPAKTIRIGRHPDNDIALGNLEVSRHHAELRRHPDGYLCAAVVVVRKGTGRTSHAGPDRSSDLWYV